MERKENIKVTNLGVSKSDTIHKECFQFQRQSHVSGGWTIDIETRAL